MDSLLFYKKMIRLTQPVIKCKAQYVMCIQKKQVSIIYQENESDRDQAFPNL